MELIGFEYSEFEGSSRQWNLKHIDIGQIKLIVGRNATGKTRTLNVIAGLAGILSGATRRLFLSGSYKAYFQGERGTGIYELGYKDNSIIFERYSVGGKVVLDRDKDGFTKMLAENLTPNEIEIGIPKDQIAAFVRRDSINHPFLDELYNWASSVRHYQVSGPGLGKQNLIIKVSSAAETVKADLPIPGPAETVPMFQRGITELGDKYRKQILKDMKAFGYECTDIGLVPLDKEEVLNSPFQPTALFIQERDLKCPTRQIEISDGMFSALGLVIHLNYLALSKRQSCILIDDIGENLDFDRSSRVIKILIEKALRSKIQIIMTTNNRFVMNAAPLEYWSILDRRGHTVSEFSRAKNQKLFESFKFTGLENFDLFSSGMYKAKPRSK